MAIEPAILRSLMHSPICQRARPKAGLQASRKQVQEDQIPLCHKGIDMKISYYIWLADTRKEQNLNDLERLASRIIRIFSDPIIQRDVLPIDRPF
jgi:hypothetical protein